ncbi:MAG: alpha-2-macroglobulin family protein, partial [Ramlibacter sp.]
ASYSDTNGEVQTLRSVNTLWPANVLAGIKTEGWVSASQKVHFQALALQLDGKAAEGVPLEVRAMARTVTTSRKRMVGGFYTYDNKTEVKDLGQVCKGNSDARGLLLCEARLGEPGEVDLVVTATDAQGKTIQAAGSVWVTRQGELWFGGENHDRIDVLPEKKSYQPGETARFQVRMPFRFATALVAVEREGIVETKVVELHGDDPTVSLKIKEGWGPNVYVSVLALRGRLREVPWYSLFTWGYKAPREWWTAFWYEGREYVAPTALVDLSKPAYRLGLAEIRVGTKVHQLAVSVKADKESYPVRGQARVTISVTLPNGQPAAHAEVALAAVDQALLELMPNNSWQLLEAMLQRRSLGVETSTAQMDIIGRRHYGRKAVPAGGGGGKSPTRELLDTLLLWNPRVVLDAAGQAVVTVPLNDALTSFRIVAVADAGTSLFGTGQTTVRATQDLQIISGLPPLVREGDQFRAQITLRNTTAKPMKVEVAPRATLLTLAPQGIDIPAGEAREAAWMVTAPAQLGTIRSEAILWEIEAKDTAGGARDALKASQRIIPAVPLTVQQATLVQVDGPFTLGVGPPADALPAEGAKRGGLKMALQPRLAEGLPGVRDWFANYPFACLEQKTSKAVGLRDARLWQTVVGQLPTYLDGDGLASYFPPREGEGNRGSDTLTAYLLAATHEASGLNPAFALPDDVRAPMERGLIAFVEGRIQRAAWSPRQDLEVRKIAAIEALSRYGRAQGRMLGSITIAPNQWPTHAVIDWYNILKRVTDVPQRDQRLAEATQVLRARLSFQGTKVLFSTEKDDYWWWLMTNGDVNTARLILAVMDDPAWKDDMGRLANGFIGRQQGGAWHTTTANLWGGLALEKFSAKFEATPVTGVTRASLGKALAGVDWKKVERVKATDAAGAPNQITMFGAPASPGNLRGNTMFVPWGANATDTLNVTHQGTGKPWLTLLSLAAIDLKAPFNAGYQLTKTITPVEQAVPGKYSRGDVLRVALEINASSDMTWVVVTDPIPGGSTLLGGGLGRDSQIATGGQKAPTGVWAAFEERSFESWRGYYEYVPKGIFKVEYTVRLNNVGEFALPPSRVEAMYAPEMFGETPNAKVKVEAGR